MQSNSPWKKIQQYVKMQICWATTVASMQLFIAVDGLISVIDFNRLRAKLFRGNINIYLHFVSFLHIDTTQVFEILPQIKQEPTYST